MIRVYRVGRLRAGFAQYCLERSVNVWLFSTLPVDKFHSDIRENNLQVRW